MNVCYVGQSSAPHSNFAVFVDFEVVLHRVKMMQVVGVFPYSLAGTLVAQYFLDMILISLSVKLTILQAVA